MSAKNTPNRKAIVEKIQSLMNVTEDNGAFPQEIATATAAIQKLMEKYSIELGEVLAADEEKLAKVFETATADTVLFNTLAWHWKLASLIARVTHTKHYRVARTSNEPVNKVAESYSERKHKADKYVKTEYRTFCFFGEKENVRTAVRLLDQWLGEIDYMSLQARHAYSKAQREDPTGHPDSARSYRRSWLDGCLDGMLANVIAQEEARAKKASTEIVLYDDKVEEAYGEYAKSIGMRNIKIGGTRQFSWEGYKDGEETGKQINPGSERVPAKAKSTKKASKKASKKALKAEPVPA